MNEMDFENEIWGLENSRDKCIEEANCRPLRDRWCTSGIRTCQRNANHDIDQSKSIEY